MDLLEYLKTLDIETSNEPQVKKFLNLKENDLRSSVRKLWDDFIKEEEKALAKIPEHPLNTTSKISSDGKTECIITEPTKAEDKNDNSNQTVNQNNSSSENPEKLHTPQNQLNSVKASKSDEVQFDLQIKRRTIPIPNGKENQQYSYDFVLDSLDLSDIGEYWIEGLDELGLTFDKTTNKITGIPVKSGDHKIKLKIKRKDWVDGKPVFERELLFIVNPDPKKLWKNIPTPTDIEFYKPDNDKCFIKVEAQTDFFLHKKPKKDIVAASQRGRSHAQEGKPRDDHFSLKYLKSHDWYILSVADGAGSAKSSRRGSEIACNTVSQICEELIISDHKNLEEHIKEFQKDSTEGNRKAMGDTLYNIIGTAVFKSVKKIEEEAKASGKPIKDFSTTLIVCICKKFKFGWFVGSFWVGDGGIGIYDEKRKYLKVLGEADSGEFAGQTRFLTMPEISEPKELYRRLRFEIVEDFTALMMMTDGVTDPKFETDANIQKIEKWDSLWKDLSDEVTLKDDNESAADQLLNWLDFWSPGNHDDRTIAILF